MEVIVVDNASTDGSQQKLNEKYPHVKLIANTENVGFAAANNQGMEIAGGNYLLLLNSDAFLMTDTLTQVFSFFNQHSQVGVCAAKITQSRRFISSLLC
jgi:GT2 family glycosyltransferase